jgi:hypothetical protein
MAVRCQPALPPGNPPPTPAATPAGGGGQPFPSPAHTARTAMLTTKSASRPGGKAQRGPSKTPAQPLADKGVVLLRSEKRSWFSIAISGFGGVLVQYLKTVRERLRAVRTRPPRVRPGRVRRRP